MSKLRAFRAVAIVEAASYVALLAASVAKRAFDAPGFVPVIGPVHGIVVLVYFAFALVLRDDLEWRWTKTLFVMAAALIPFGGIYVERTLDDRAVPAAGRAS